MTKNYTVEGMTCHHCVASVTEEVGEIPGVQDVDVSLEGGHLAVSGQGFTDDQVAEAVIEAGYQLAQN